MTLTANLRTEIKNLPAGVLFGYADLPLEKKNFQTAAKALQRLQTEGLIKKISKGIFYRPRQSVFGELKPTDDALLQTYLFDGGRRIAYITGSSLYNSLGLTTQMAFSLKIASREKRISINKGALKARAVKSYAEVTDENYKLLGYLDALKDLKTIPDSDARQAIAIMSNLIKKLSTKEIGEMGKYVLAYPSRARALFGAIMEDLGETPANLVKLKDSLNPLTTVKIGLQESDLATAKNWGIV